jgi:WD40 repeat protein
VNNVLQARATGGSAAAAAGDINDLSLVEVNSLLGKLSDRKRSLHRGMEVLDYQLVREFLAQVKKNKEEQRAAIDNELGLLTADLATLEEGIRVENVNSDAGGSGDQSGKRKRTASPAFGGGGSGSSSGTAADDGSGAVYIRTSNWADAEDYAVAKSELSGEGAAGGGAVEGSGGATEPCAVDQCSNTDGGHGRELCINHDGQLDAHERCKGAACSKCVLTAAAGPATSAEDDREMPRRRRRMQQHHRDLEAAYFDTHERQEGNGPNAALKHFQYNVSRFTRYSKFTIFAQLSYNPLGPGSSSIVSSIEFDKHDENFATAGVTKEIKIYEYKSIVEQPQIETHCPVKRMQCRSKISCLSWNPYFKEWIASSDYEGVVSCWDAYTGQRLSQYEEHEKRAWSVDFCKTKPKMLASGSDDLKVKIWDVDVPRQSVATVTSKANVCCVKFNPESANYIAFGSADHHIHYYDLRHLKKELFVFKGHAKAVSYVRFLSATELVSASTDSTLKLWSTTQNECTRTFTGHTNEKNFVGLSVSNDYIACGSENNAVYTYYKSLPRPVVCHKFPANKKAGRQSESSATDSNDFVSSVCWKKDSNVLLAANSQGTINVMTLTH